MSDCNCTYCRGFCETPVINTRTKLSFKSESYPGIEAYVEDGMLYVCTEGDTYEPSYQEAEAPINFCPMCGRKFKEDK